MNFGGSRQAVGWLSACRSLGDAPELVQHLTIGSNEEGR